MIAYVILWICFKCPVDCQSWWGVQSRCIYCSMPIQSIAMRHTASASSSTCSRGSRRSCRAMPPWTSCTSWSPNSPNRHLPSHSKGMPWMGWWGPSASCPSWGSPSHICEWCAILPSGCISRRSLLWQKELIIKSMAGNIIFNRFKMLRMVKMFEMVKIFNMLKTPSMFKIYSKSNFKVLLKYFKSTFKLLLKYFTCTFKVL